jgi:hypothetical protein
MFPFSYLHGIQGPSHLDVSENINVVGYIKIIVKSTYITNAVLYMNIDYALKMGGNVRV